jgi:hypothetical protein
MKTKQRVAAADPDVIALFNQLQHIRRNQRTLRTIYRHVPAGSRNECKAWRDEARVWQQLIEQFLSAGKKG